MTDEALSDDEEDRVLAAELALRLLEGEEDRAARLRLTRDPQFADLVATWNERFYPMAEEIPAKAPRRRVKKRLMHTLFPSERVPLGQRLWVWKGVAVAAVVVAGYLGVQQLGPQVPDVGGTLFATQLTSDALPLQVLAVLDPARGEIALNRIAGTPAAGRDFELWAILPDSAPVSLGVLPEVQTTRVVLPQALLARAAEVTLAISDEPTGGSTTGAPTGDVLAAAPVSSL